MYEYVQHELLAVTLTIRTMIVKQARDCKQTSKNPVAW